MTKKHNNHDSKKDQFHLFYWNHTKHSLRGSFLSISTSTMIQSLWHFPSDSASQDPIEANFQGHRMASSQPSLICKTKTKNPQRRAEPFLGVGVVVSNTSLQNFFCLMYFHPQVKKDLNLSENPHKTIFCDFSQIQESLNIFWFCTSKIAEMYNAIILFSGFRNLVFTLLFLVLVWNKIQFYYSIHINIHGLLLVFTLIF